MGNLACVAVVCFLVARDTSSRRELADEAQLAGLDRFMSLVNDFFRCIFSTPIISITQNRLK